MALMINDLEKNLELSTSELADVNGGCWGHYPRYRKPRCFYPMPRLPLPCYPIYPYGHVGVANAGATANATGVNFATTNTNTFSQVGPGFASASSSSQSSAG